VKSAQPECTGISRIVRGLAKRAGSLGYEISVLFLEEGPLEAAFLAEGIQASTVSWSGTRDDLAGAWRAWTWLRRHPAEIVHLHHGGLRVRALCRLAGVSSVVQHIHSRILENKGISVSQLKFRLADAVISNSEAVADCLRGCRSEVVYAGVETGSEPPATASAIGPLKVGVLSRLIPLKNIEAAIEATAELANRGVEVRLDVAGSGPSESSLHDLAARLGVTERVRFIGWRADVQELLASWNLLLVPSLEEGFGYSALEAMAAARPVIASRVGGLCELIVDGVTGRLISPGDTESLVGCIAELARNRRRLELMGIEGWKRAQKCFSADLMARHTVEIYDRILNRNTNK